MNKKKKNVKLPNYLEKEAEVNEKNEKDKFDEFWDGETIDEDKNKGT